MLAYNTVMERLHTTEKKAVLWGRMPFSFMVKMRQEARKEGKSITLYVHDVFINRIWNDKQPSKG